MSSIEPSGDLQEICVKLQREMHPTEEHEPEKSIEITSENIPVTYAEPPLQYRAGLDNDGRPVASYEALKRRIRRAEAAQPVTVRQKPAISIQPEQTQTHIQKMITQQKEILRQRMIAQVAQQQAVTPDTRRVVNAQPLSMDVFGPVTTITKPIFSPEMGLFGKSRTKKKNGGGMW